MSDTGLIISDLHAPYNHPDAIDFLKALKKKYQPTWVVGIGDELDYHAMSFHDADPDLPSAGEELERGRAVLSQIEKLFPEVDLLDSNHGSMKYRRAKVAGVPATLMVSYNEACGVGDGWNWHQHFSKNVAKNEIYFVHGKSISTKRNTEQTGCSFVQGHHHGTFEIVYNGTPASLNWGMTVGCLIDDSSLAFAYNKNTLKRPIIGCGVIINGQPKLLPMILERGGRWNGETP